MRLRAVLYSSSSLDENGDAAEHYLSIVDQVLQSSEVQWRAWKKNKFQIDLDLKPGAKEDNSVSAAATASKAPSRKRRRNDTAIADVSLLDLRTDLPSVVQAMHKAKHSTGTHLVDYIEALDPESGIEPEYHPKNDALFGW